jgi:hypothetical protein
MSVAAASGVSRASIERLELGTLRSLSIIQAAILSAVVGLDLSLRTYPGPTGARDAGQLRLLGRLRVRLGPHWVWEFEVPLGLPQDQRAWDARVRHEVTGATFVIEAVVRVTDVQGLLRRIALKRRDGESPRVILLLAQTRANPSVLFSPDDVFGSAFPLRTRAALQALIDGKDPGADAIVVL